MKSHSFAANGIQEDFNLPMNSIPGSEMTREPFRWDQRLFALVLRLAGTPAIERDTGLVPSDSSPIDAMCEVTGGRSYCITSHRMLNQCIDSLVQKVFIYPISSEQNVLLVWYLKYMYLNKVLH